MADDASVLNEVKDITECPICCGVFADPRSLPCVHTFCLRCIAQWSENERRGQYVSCPLCRKNFLVPAQGVAGLPKNIYIDRLIAAKQSPVPANATSETVAERRHANRSTEPQPHFDEKGQVSDQPQRSAHNRFDPMNAARVEPANCGNFLPDGMHDFDDRPDPRPNFDDYWNPVGYMGAGVPYQMFGTARGYDQQGASRNHHANQMNPNNAAYVSRMNNHSNQMNPTSSAYRAASNNRSNQMNPNNSAYHASRGGSSGGSKASGRRK